MKGLCLVPVLLAMLIVFISECRPKSVTAESSSSSTEAESYGWNFLNEQKPQQHRRHKRFIDTIIGLTGVILSATSLGLSESNNKKQTAAMADIQGSLAKQGDDITDIRSSLAKQGDDIADVQQALARHHREMVDVKLKLQHLDGNLDSLAKDVESLKELVVDGQDRVLTGQDRIQATCLYGRDMARLRFLLSHLNNFLTLQNDSSLAPKELAKTWADGVLDMGVDGVAQVLHDIHDMVMGDSPLFSHKPIFLIFENQLDRDLSSYWSQVMQITEYLYFIQVAGYAVWYTALNVKARHAEVENVRQMALTRLTEQGQIMKPLLLEWPSGTYALPMTDTGCPLGAGTQWINGSRRHDTENDVSSGYNNGWNPDDIHFPPGSYGKNDMTQHFCSKTEEGGSGPWPKGNYCIFMKDGKCPTGFSFGFIRWDDEDTNNHNSVSGSVPEGQYDRNTIIFYCCRSDGPASTPIDLPNRKAFYLLRYGSECQQVEDMKVRKEEFWWDNENDNDKESVKYGAHPSAYFSSASGNHCIYYCYYHL